MLLILEQLRFRRLPVLSRQVFRLRRRALHVRLQARLVLEVRRGHVAFLHISAVTPLLEMLHSK